MTSEVHAALKHYVAEAAEVGPYGAPDERHYRIDEKYAVPFLARRLDVDADEAGRLLRELAREVGAGEAQIVYRFWVFPAAMVESG